MKKHFLVALLLMLGIAAYAPAAQMSFTFDQSNVANPVVNVEVTITDLADLGGSGGVQIDDVHRTGVDDENAGMNRFDDGSEPGFALLDADAQLLFLGQGAAEPLEQYGNGNRCHPA